jgi:sugar/nucleoside kinase (ribokinase family)
MTHSEPPTDFLTIGELLVDFSQTTPGPQGYPQYEALPGGAVANVAVAMAKWGRRSGFIGNVGQDALGAMLAETLKGAGVDCTRLLPSRQPTSLAMVSLAEDGDRSFAFYWKDTSCSSLDPALAEPATCCGSRIFHFGSVSLSAPQSRETTLRAVRAARAAGAVISFDANLRPGLWDWEPERAREPILEAMKLAHIVKLSEEELYFLGGIQTAALAIHRDAPETGRLMAELVAATGVPLLFVTFGAAGSRWLGRAGAGRLDSLQVKPVDTTGAGDCFMAGVLHQFLTLDRRLQELGSADYLAMACQGVTSGALSTEKRGAIPSIPTLDEIRARLPK